MHHGDFPMMQLSATKLFVFDFDGTLVQSNAIKSTAFFDVTAHISGARGHLENLLQTRPELDRYGIFGALAELIEDIDPDALAKAYGVHCKERILNCPEVPGTTILLTKLMETGRTAIINSATPEVPLRDVVPQLPFGSLIHTIYGEPASKAENLNKAMALCDVGPEQTIMVGDRESDRMSAEQTGCKFIGVQSDLTDYDVPPETVVKQLDEIVAWL